MFFKKDSSLDVMREWEHCPDKAVSHQLPIVATFGIIQIISTGECLSLTQNLMQICCSTHLVFLNVTATPYTYSLSGIYCPHWLVQWSRHCSHMCIPVHSPWLPGYIDVTQTILTLTMAGLFPDRHCHSLLFSSSASLPWPIPHISHESLLHLSQRLTLLEMWV